MSEFLQRRRMNLVGAGLLAGSLLMGACSSDSSDGPVETTPTTEYVPTAEDIAAEKEVVNRQMNAFKERSEEIVEQLRQAPMTEPTLLADGRRITIISAPTIAYGYNNEPVVKIEFCNGPNLDTLFQHSMNSDDNYTISGDPIIDKGNAWCADGRLTEADFPPQS